MAKKVIFLFDSRSKNPESEIKASIEEYEKTGEQILPIPFDDDSDLNAAKYLIEDSADEIWLVGDYMNNFMKKQVLFALECGKSTIGKTEKMEFALGLILNPA